MLLFESAALGADFGERHVRGVVHVQRGVVDASHGVGQGGPVAALVEVAVTQRLQWDTGFS